MLLIKGMLKKTKILSRMVLTITPKRGLVLDIEAHFGDSGYMLHLLEEGPSPKIELTKEAALKFYQQMYEIRRVEEHCAVLYAKKICRGFCHLYIGQEAIAVGINSVMRPQDTIITSYRCHGWGVLKCESITAMFAELMGLTAGVSRGKGGSIHIFGPNFFGGNGIVGAQVPLGTGIALRHKYEKSDAVCVSLFGDGAFNQGQVFESMNFAKLHMLPVIFVVENNHYGMGTSAPRSSATAKYYSGCTFLPGIRANGNDILSVVGTASFAFKHIHDGNGPIVLEFMTYRYFGHSMSDPGTTYRDRAEIQKVRVERDPIKHLKKLILDSNLATEEEIAKVHKETKKKVQEALDEAYKSKPPPLEELTTDCYRSFEDKVRVPKMLTYSPHKNSTKNKESKKYYTMSFLYPYVLST